MSGNKSVPIFFFCLIALLLPAWCRAQTVINVKDFGALGDGTTDDLPALNRALAAARKEAGTPVTIRIPDGQYRLSLDANAEVDAHFNVASMANLIITGADQTTLIFGSPYHNGIALLDSERITIRNLALDYDPLPFTQGIVVNVSPEQNFIDMELDEGYPPPTAPHIDALTGTNTKNVGYLFDVSTNLKAQQYYDQYLRKQVQALGDRVYRYISSNKVESDMVGKRFVVVGRRRANAVKVHRSTDSLIENVRVFAAPSSGFNVSASSGITIDHCRIEQKPKTNRAMSTNADGLHSKWCPVGPTLSSSYFTGMGDDAVNIGGTYTPVLDQLGDSIMIVEGNRTITDYPLDLYITVAGEIGHVSLPKVLKMKGTRIKGYKKPALELTFDAPLPKLQTWQQTKDPRKSSQVYNLNACGRYAKVINNHFYNHRARGVLMRSPDGLIRGNVFDTLAGPGVVVSNDGGFLAEGPGGSRTVIENNIFTRIQRSNIWINSSLPPLIEGVVIRGNNFVDFGGNSRHGRGITGNVFYINKAVNLVVEDNKIDKPATGTGSAAVILQRNTQGTIWKDNSVGGGPLDLHKDVQQLAD